MRIKETKYSTNEKLIPRKQYASGGELVKDYV